MTRRIRILSLTLMLLLLLGACEDTPTPVDCDATPEHADCLPADPTHGVTFHHAADLVVPQYVFDEKFWGDVSATDEDGNELTLFVDHAIDFDRAGAYPVTYRVVLEDGTTFTTDVTLTVKDLGGTEFDSMVSALQQETSSLVAGPYAFVRTTYNPTRGDTFEHVDTRRYEYDTNHTRLFIDTNPVLTNQPHQSYLLWDAMSYANEGDYLVGDAYPVEIPVWDLMDGWDDLPDRYTTIEEDTHTFYLSYADLAAFADQPSLLGDIHDTYRSDLAEDHVRVRFDVQIVNGAIGLVVSFFNTDNSYDYRLEYLVTDVSSTPLDVTRLSQIGASGLDKVDFGIVQGVAHNFSYDTQDDRYFKIAITEGMYYEVRTPWFDQYTFYDDQLQSFDLNLVTIPLVGETRYWFQAPYTGDLHLERTAYAYDIEEIIPFFYDQLDTSPQEDEVVLDGGVSSYTVTGTARFTGVRLVIPVTPGAEYRFTFANDTTLYAFLNASSNDINGDVRYYNPTGDTIELILYDDVQVSWDLVTD